MKSKINLSNIRNCDQVWEDMKILDQGRQCAKCKEVIHDFRGLSDWEIAMKHAESPSRVCGIYDQDDTQHTPNSFFVDMNTLKIATMMGLMATSTALPAQTPTQESKIVQTENTHLNNSTEIIGTEKKMHDPSPDTVVTNKYIQGVLVDEVGDPIIGASAHIEGTDLGELTDNDGQFLIFLPAEYSERDSVNIIFSSIGKGWEKQTFHKEDFQTQIELKSVMVTMEYTSVSSFRAIPRPSWSKRMWRKMKGIFKR